MFCGTYFRQFAHILYLDKMYDTVFKTLGVTSQESILSVSLFLFVFFAGGRDCVCLAVFSNSS